MMAILFRMRRCRALAVIVGCLLTIVVCGVGVPDTVAFNTPLSDGQSLSRQADTLIKEGREEQAADLYLAAHVQFQKIILTYFESALRESLGGSPSQGDEEALMRKGSLVGDLRNVNLSKLWIVLDPDDRSYEQGLEEERAALLEHFDRFVRGESAGPLEAFLSRLYPEDESGERQMEAVRDGRMPPSKRWERLHRTLSP